MIQQIIQHRTMIKKRNNVDNLTNEGSVIIILRKKQHKMIQQRMMIQQRIQQKMMMKKRTQGRFTGQSNIYVKCCEDILPNLLN